MPTTDPLGEELRTTWQREIPLAAAMGIEVLAIESGELTVSAPVAKNINVHGTAFAGSLFSVAVLAGWGSVWLALRHAGLEGRIVVVDSRIRYLRPVTGEILCRCRPDPDRVAEALRDLTAAGRATLPVTSSIDWRGARAVEFAGDYAIRLRPE